MAAPESNGLTYDRISLSDSEIANGEYKKYLGGGRQFWEQRGRFQLQFLRDRGLKPDHKLIDIGCGPGRAGLFFIDYLGSHLYIGIDYNKDFIDAFEQQISAKALKIKEPLLKVTSDFRLGDEIYSVDFAIAFSVLNHCNMQQREAFFSNIPPHLKRTGRLFISHAGWFSQSYISNLDLKVVNAYTQKDYDITNHGWEPGESIFPIIEIVRD